jgi:hypothetical protein
MGFLMTKSSPNFIDSRSAGLARVRLRVPKNNSQPAPQRPNQRKLTPPLSTVPRWHSIFIQMPSPAILRIIQSP